MTTFESLALALPLQRALAALNYTEPTPIQAQAIPPLLDGRDVLGCAQTGTGKTAAFALPILQHFAETPRDRGKAIVRTLVLTPTRELAAQIGESFAGYGKFLKARHLVIFGGVNDKPQIAKLRGGIDIVVATPGRLIDLHRRGHISLADVEFFVLDEADRMLDMGFVHDVKRVISHLPVDRQNLLFSATMPPAIVSLASSFLRDPVSVEVTPQATTVERINQTVMFVDRPDKKRLLVEFIRNRGVERAIVFTRTKHGANRLATQLDKANIRAAAIHGNKSQNARTRALDGFRAGTIPILIATDIASRGIDVDDVSHVFNYDLPNEPESYVHRIGRTGRAGRSGIAVSFCDDTEGEYLRDIERTIGMAVPVVLDHEFHFPAAVPPPGRSSRNSGRKPPQSRRSQPGRGRGPRPGGARGQDSRRDGEQRRDGGQGRDPRSRGDGARRDGEQRRGPRSEAGANTRDGGQQRDRADRPPARQGRRPRRKPASA